MCRGKTRFGFWWFPTTPSDLGGVALGRRAWTEDVFGCSTAEVNDEKGARRMFCSYFNWSHIPMDHHVLFYFADL